MSLSPPLAVSPALPRVQSLDALRGFAILTMVLSGLLPFYRETLPAWMYHAQVPPPTHRFDPSIPGITWVDLVFPMFLFAMGAAIPLALGGRLARGKSVWQLIPGIFGRGVALAFFAVYIQNFSPWHLGNPPTTTDWLKALAGFALLFPIFTRLPEGLLKRLGKWGPATTWGVKTLAIAIAWLLVRHHVYGNGQGFTVRRFDIIIMLLGNTVVTGSLIWLATRRSLAARLLVLGGVYALLEANKVSGSWVNVLFKPVIKLSDWSYAFGWLFDLSWQKYLFLVVPGTIVGDAFADWMAQRRAAPEAEARASWARSSLVLMSLVLVALVIFVHAGLFARWTTVTSLATFAILAMFWLSVARPMTPSEHLLRQLFGWGAALLVIGLLFEPAEGGIRKDHATMSYYFVTGGLSALLLWCFTVWIDLMGLRRTFWLLTSNGQNPMIAYAGQRCFIEPLVHLPKLAGVSLNAWVLENVLRGPWARALWGLTKTVVLATLVGILTRLRVFWRT